MSIGLLEILILLVVFLAVGPRRITNLFRAMGRGAYDFVETLGRDKNQELPDEEKEDQEIERR